MMQSVVGQKRTSIHFLQKKEKEEEKKKKRKSTGKIKEITKEKRKEKE